MSSLGGQWRVLRLLSTAELDKLVRRLRPVVAAAPQFDQLIKKLEKVLSVKLTRDEKELLDKEGSVQAGPSPQPTTARPASQPAAQPAARPVPVPHATPHPSSKLSNHPEPPGVDKTTTPTGGLHVGSEAKEITMEGLLQGLKLKKDLHFGKISQLGWKDNKPIVTKSSIHSRTAYVISALAAAGGAACLTKRTHDFIQHVAQYPETRDLAIKEGAVRVLLRVQDRMRGDSPEMKEVQGIVNEALALVGYCAPPSSPGPNILSLDGGGIRGLIAIEVLRHLERLTGRPVNKLFDYIIGVSTGAIIAAVIGGGVGNLDTASKMYHTLSKEMFGNTSLIGGTSRLVWSHSYYDTGVWEKLLQDNLGNSMLTHCNRTNNPKMALVSCVVGSGGQRLAPFLFRTYSVGYRVRAAHRGTTVAPIWHAVRASAAAPAYFTEFTHQDSVHQDGGLIVNNPAGVGLHEAKLLWGSAELSRGTVVSLGTGKAPAVAPSKTEAPKSPVSTSWKDKFNTILDSATDTEGVHLMLNDLLPTGNYYRFNPPLMESCAMDEIDPRRLHNMITDTHAYIRRNQHKFEEAARRLTRPRSLPQRVGDAIHRKAIILGLTHTH